MCLLAVLSYDLRAIRVELWTLKETDFQVEDDLDAPSTSGIRSAPKSQATQNVASTSHAPVQADKSNQILHRKYE